MPERIPSGEMPTVSSDLEKPLNGEEMDNLCNNSYEYGTKAWDSCKDSPKYPVTLIAESDSSKRLISLGDEKKSSYAEVEQMFYSNRDGHKKKPTDCFTGSLENVNRWNIILSVLVVGACVLSTVLTITVMKTHGLCVAVPEATETPDRQFPDGVCVQCIKLVHDPFNHLAADPLIDKLVKRLDDGFQMCCAESEEQLSALVEASMREQVTKPVPRSDSTNTSLQFVPVSAHKQLLSPDDRELNLTALYYGNRTEHFLVKLNSKYNDPHTEHAHGVTVLDTALQVEYSGVYYVYFSVSIKPRFNSPPGSVQYVQDWGQSVHHTRPNSPANSGVLLQVSHTPCSDCSQHQESTFAGGTFRLQKNDLIQVCLAGLGLVQYRKESSYLGIVLLSNSPTEK